MNSFLDAIRERMNRQPAISVPIPPQERIVSEIAGVKISFAAASQSEEELERVELPPLPNDVMSISNRTTLQKMFEQQNKDQNQELEFSIGSYEGDKFYPGFQSFIPVARLLKEYIREHGQPEVIRDTVMVAGNTRRVTSEGGGVHYERKVRSKDSIDDHEWGYRVVMSYEEQGITDVNDDEFERNATVIRVRNRSSFEFDNVRLDVTIVNQTSIKDGELGRPLIKYEVELERLGNIGVDGFVKHIEAIYTVLGGGDLISWQQRLFITRQHNKLFGFQPKGVTKMFSRYWNKPENISIDADILDDLKFNPAVTTKLDGERRMLLILSNVTCLVWSPDEITIVGSGSVALSGTLIDVEYMKDDESKQKLDSYEGEIHAFDLLFLCGEDVRMKPLRTRINLLLTLLDKTSKIFSAKGATLKGVSFIDPTARASTQQTLPPLAPLPGSVRIGMSDEKRRALGLPVRSRVEVIVTTSKSKLVFAIDSKDVAPGNGIGEQLDEDEDLSQLLSIEKWRSKLSNLFGCSFLYDGKEFTSAEHAIQYAKFRETGHDDVALKFVQSEWSPEDARLYGQDRNINLEEKGKKTGIITLSDEEKAKWLVVREGRMADVARAKFTQCLPVQRVLLATGNAQLVCSDSGGEEHWPFLELLREQLRSDAVKAPSNKMRAKAEKESGVELAKLKFNVKQFYFPVEFGEGKFNDMYERAEECLATPVLGRDGKPLPTDGIILQGLEGYNDKARKWKPESKLTIDFRVKKTDFGYQLFVGNKGGETLFVGSRREPISNDFVVDGDFTDGGIYEMKWNGSTFVAERERPDKTEPNYIVTATSVWSDINDPISEADITGHGLRVMRRYINRVKESLLNQEVGSGTILDWGTGRGGMFGIWNRVGIKKAFGVEPDDDNRQEQLRRMKSMKMKTQVVQIASGAEDVDKIAPVTCNTDIDAITTFFSLTFFPQSKTKYDAMLKTIGTIRPNKVVGMVLDGDRVKNDLLKSLIGAEEGDAGQIATKAFTITQTSAFTNNAFDNEIETRIEDESSMVKDVQEWLFFFQYFVDEMRSLGYKLVVDKFLEDKPQTMFSRLSSEARQFSAYNRTFSFVRMGIHRAVVGKMMVLQDGDEQPLPGVLENVMYQGVGLENSLANAILRGSGEKVGDFVEWASEHKTVKDISDSLHTNVIVLLADERRIKKQQRIVGVFPSLESRTDLVNAPVVIVYTPDSIHYHHVYFKAPKQTLEQLHRLAEKKKVANHEKMNAKQLREALRLSDAKSGEDEHSFDLDDDIVKQLLSIKHVECAVEEPSEETEDVEEAEDAEEAVDFFSLNEAQLDAHQKMFEVFGDNREGVTVEDIVKKLDKFKVGKKLDIAERMDVAKVLIAQFAEEKGAEGDLESDLEGAEDEGDVEDEAVEIE